MNTTVCEGSTATFTCVVFIQSGIPAAPSWLRNGVLVDVNNMMRHTIVDNLTANTPVYISSTLTVSNITTSDDGNLYLCGVSVAISNIAMLNVAGTYIYMYVFHECCFYTTGVLLKSLWFFDFCFTVYDPVVNLL